MFLLGEANTYNTTSMIQNSSENTRDNFEQEMGDINEKQSTKGVENYRYNCNGKSICGTISADTMELRISHVHGCSDPEDFKEIFNKVVENVECNHPEIDMITWYVSKENAKMKMMMAFKSHFEVYEARPHHFVLAFHVSNKIDSIFGKSASSLGFVGSEQQ